MRDFLAVVERARDLVDAADPTFGDPQIAFAGDVLVGLDGIDALVDLVDFEADAEGGERRGLHQADVPDGALVDSAVELFLVEPGSDLPLELASACARV